MNLGRMLSDHRKLLVFGALLAVAGLAVVSALVAPAGGQEKASAQIAGCDDDIFGLLCLRKDAPSRAPFTFDIERDEQRFTAEEIPCINPAENGSEFTEVLRGGDEVAIYFGCGIRVRERQEPGWDLVDIRCDYEEDYYEVRREGDGLLILVDRGSQDSTGPIGQRRDIECIFVNREERSNLGAGLGGLFAGQPTPLPTARPAAVAPAATAPSISPPHTGDAGIK